MSTTETESVRGPTPRRRVPWVGLVLPLVLLALAAGIARALLASGPDATRRPAERRARLVEVVSVARGTAPVRVGAMGTVRAAREVVLAPEVAGRVIEVSPQLRPGGRFARDAVVLRLDPRDHELTLRQRESELATAEAELALEQGSQAVARREVEMLGEDLDDGEMALALRAPQLASARARVEAARASVDEARLALERTTVRAPFDAIVADREVDVGARVAAGSALATLVGTEAYWVEALVPVADLGWLEMPGATVEVTPLDAPPGSASHSGQLLGLAHAVDDAGRMARLLVEVPDPLGVAADAPAASPLLAGAYVRVDIEGRPLDDVVALDRAWLRDGERVWVMDETDSLVVRSVDIAFRGDAEVLVRDGLEGGDRVVVSPLAAPVDGMPLRIDEERQP